MSKQPIVSPKMYSAPRGGTFSAGIIAPKGRTIYVSGLTPREKSGEIVGVGDIGKQTEQVLENLKAVLEEAGATFDDIVKLTVFVTDVSEFDKIHEVRRRYFREPFPASTMVEVVSLVDPRMLIEIEAIAVVPED